MTDTDNTPMKLAVRAEITRAYGGDDRPTREDLMALARKHAPDPDLLESLDPYFGAAIISSNRIDSYFTFMDEETTLRNFAKDAVGGVSVLDSHDSRRLGFGRSINGMVDENDPAFRTTAWWYTPRGVRTSTGAMTDDYILNMQTGIYRDVSVGFRKLSKRSIVECSICQKDMFGWDCRHWPGQTYMVHTDPEDDTSPEVERTAVGKIINFGLSEFSYVYKGANEDAVDDGTLSIPESKVRMYVNAGELSLKEGLALERMYGFAVPNLRDLHDTYPSAAVPTQERDDIMTWSDTDKSLFDAAFGRTPNDEELAQEPVDAFRGMKATVEHTSVDTVPRADFDTLTTERDTLKAAVDDLTPRAAIGDKAIENARAEALKQATRAALSPEKFDAERIKRLLANADLDDTLALAEDWRAQADAKLGQGGRKHREAPDNYETETPTPLHADDRRRAENFASR